MRCTFGLLLCLLQTAAASAVASDSAVVTATLRWLDGWIIKRSLCPFAAAARSHTKTVVCRGGAKEASVAVGVEVASLRNAPVESPATTLLILPDLADSFEDLMYLQEAESQKLEEEDGSQPVIQLLAFHPLAEFGEMPNDAADLSMQSPYPILHLLRDSDVGAAEEQWERQHAPAVAPSIQERNAAMLRGMGYEAAAAESRASWGSDVSNPV
jgi:hypothetical protein